MQIPGTVSQSGYELLLQSQIVGVRGVALFPDLGESRTYLARMASIHQACFYESEKLGLAHSAGRIGRIGCKPHTIRGG